MTQNYDLLESANNNRNDDEDSTPVRPERKKTGFDPFDPISVKLMTIGNVHFTVNKINAEAIENHSELVWENIGFPCW